MTSGDTGSGTGNISQNAIEWFFVPPVLFSGIPLFQPVFSKCGSDRAGNPHCAGNLSLLFYICISGGLFRSAAGNGKDGGADGGYPCKYVRNPYAESLVPDAALSQRGRSGRNLSDHLDNYGCLPGRDVLAAEQKTET